MQPTPLPDIVVDLSRGTMFDANAPTARLRPALATLLVAAAAALSFALPARALSPGEIDRKVDELLGRMTLEEKVGQLNLVSHGPPLRWDDIREGKAGALLNFNSAGEVARAQSARPAVAPQDSAALRPRRPARLPNPVPPAPRGGSRLQSPPVSARGTFCRRESAYVGVQWTFAPMADLSRDSRWGRIVEGLGRTRISARS